MLNVSNRGSIVDFSCSIAYFSSKLSSDLMNETCNGCSGLQSLNIAIIKLDHQKILGKDEREFNLILE